eukprot:6190989-Pleurochrysis_carterae.AAC.2
MPRVSASSLAPLLESLLPRVASRGADPANDTACCPPKLPSEEAGGGAGKEERRRAASARSVRRWDRVRARAFCSGVSSTTGSGSLGLGGGLGGSSLLKLSAVWMLTPISMPITESTR